MWYIVWLFINQLKKQPKTYTTCPYWLNFEIWPFGVMVAKGCRAYGTHCPTDPGWQKRDFRTIIPHYSAVKKIAYGPMFGRWPIILILFLHFNSAQFITWYAFSQNCSCFYVRYEDTNIENCVRMNHSLVNWLTISHKSAGELFYCFKETFKLLGIIYWHLSGWLFLAHTIITIIIFVIIVIIHNPLVSCYLI